jgi:hypothetical protein
MVNNLTLGPFVNRFFKVASMVKQAYQTVDSNGSNAAQEKPVKQVHW